MSDAITEAIRKLTARTTAYRFYVQNERRGRMDRVSEKLKRAAGVAARSNASLEMEADKLIAREQKFEERKVAAFAPHFKLLDSRHREMDQLEDSLKIVGNADPLESSGDSSGADTEFAPTHPALEPKTEPAAFEIKPGTTPQQNMQMLQNSAAPAVAVEQSATFRPADFAEQGKL